MYNGDGFYQQRFTAEAMTQEAFDEWVSKVRSTGILLDEQSLKIISRRSTRTELLDAQSMPRSPDGNLYFTGATASLFPSVVMATMGGAVGARAASPNEKPGSPATERAP
jgi:cytochrome o ubiquinol oxidase subunit 2